ncbi:MAG: sulfotransferase domain-containing protein [Armatimonadetes bacterium]|nr:sulfotransferase domain-containing protein [Armatimonadota bacterium]
MKKLIKRLLLKIFQEHERFVQKNEIKKWNLSDVYLVSYPKSGNTFVSLLLANILKQLKGTPCRVDYFSLHEFIPDIQVNPDRITELDPPRIIKTHEHFEEWNKRISTLGKGFRFPRVIYIVRDGREVIISYYYHVKNIHGYKGSFEDFIVDKNAKLREWGDHVKGWLIDNNVLDQRNILIVKYKELRSDTFSSLKKILEFIGIEVDEEIVLRAIKDSEIKRMQSIEKQYGAPEKYANPKFTFARKGLSGDIEEEFKVLVNRFYDNVEVLEFLGY